MTMTPGRPQPQQTIAEAVSKVWAQVLKHGQAQLEQAQRARDSHNQ